MNLTPCRQMARSRLLWNWASWTIWCDWVRIQRSLCNTPAMMANLVHAVWSWETSVTKIGEDAPKPGHRKTHKMQPQEFSN
jgi:hypothetical protein